MRTDDAVALLESRGAADLPHPGGTLLEHLIRVSAELRTWGDPEAVVLAGLSHAAYGTDGFDVMLLSLDQRDVLRATIGDEAEKLVYLYGSSARNLTYPTITGPGQSTLHNRWTGQIHAMAPAEVNAFVEVTVANELDVLAHNEDLAQRHGNALCQLFHRWRPWMSQGAWSAVNSTWTGRA